MYPVVSLRTQRSYEGRQEVNSKRNYHIAFLSDAKTIRMEALDSQMPSLNIFHHRTIEFLELCESCQYCLFLDDKRDLYVFDRSMGVKSYLVGYCAFAQWVPLSHAVVAVSKGVMFVWYNVKYFDNVSSAEWR
jgi:hypothetical protein